MNNPFDHTHIQEEKAEREARRLKLRTNLLIGCFCAVLAFFFLALYQAQVVNGASYLVNSDVHTLQPEQVDSVRGEILDAYGRLLVTNEVSYNVELDLNAMGRDRIAVLRQLLALCEQSGVAWADSLPISKSAPWRYTDASPLHYTYQTEEGDAVAPTSLGKMAEQCGWVKDATASILPPARELLAKLCDELGIVELGGPVTHQDRLLAGVLYELTLRAEGYNYNTYVFARDVDIAFISRVTEHALPGVRILTTTTRRYETGYAPHVLGYTGAINASQMDHYKQLGYPGNATVGQSGVELAFEERLHGTSGIRLIERDQNGNIVNQEWQTEPGPGENLVLTLDKALQATTEDLLTQFAATQEDPGPMAAAVVDMSGGVLTLASYPTFDLTTLREHIGELSADTVNRPLYNRATQGTYAPGSTFKMCTAIAALSEGKITTRERIECTGTYTYYTSPQPHCWIWPGRHGMENVTEAIKDSCNCFFFEIGRRTTIAKLREYAQKFGLGEYTGVELVEEKGWVAGPETSEHFSMAWFDGNTLNAAIGQDNNMFTPLQLANYVATLVNGGNHYQCHLLKEFKSSDYSRVTETYNAEPLDTIDIDPSHLAAVKQGMYDLAQSPNMARYFSSLPVKVGCKTGTAEVASQTANAVFVCFAPYDDPQVALCLVAERGASGSNLAELAAGILAQYFSTDSSLSALPAEGALLR